MSECGCTEICRMGWDDQFQGATRELMVFTKSAKRFFDLDAVREPAKPGSYGTEGTGKDRSGNGFRGVTLGPTNYPRTDSNPAGAPPLDWWQIPSPKPQPTSPYEGPPMTATMYIGDVLDVLGKLPENSVDLVLSSPPFLALRSYLPADHPLKEKEGGSQSTPGEYIDWLLDVVEACDRVLAPHGSLVFELGDTYAGSDGTFRYKLEDAPNDWFRSKTQGVDAVQNAVPRSGTGWPLAKSLSLIPESFRFAMVYGQNPFTGRQTERWRLRNVIRWVRPNPPVGALGDKFRPATSDLMVFCKSAKRYFDLDAVRSPMNDHTLKYWDDPGVRKGVNESRQDGGLMFYEKEPNPAGAPPLDWWNIPPGGYEGFHYATWPKELLIKPIKAMCPEQVCRTCGEPSRREVERQAVWAASGQPSPGGGRHDGIAGIGATGFGGSSATASVVLSEAWTDCGHNNYRPGLVLDCFGGSGTTAAVATGHGRDCILIDLDERNYDLALERVGPLVLQRGEVAA